MKATCHICPHKCVREEGQTGFCGARRARDGEMSGISYGKVTALALDPIEKKPLYRFFPRTLILSAGSFGCNLRCPHCQNHGISMCGEGEAQTTDISPAMLVEQAKGLMLQGNIGIALTYNEPLVGFEYAMDVFAAARDAGLKTVLVTNGYAEEGPFGELLSRTDAMNIDLKAFNEAFYRKISGQLSVVMRSIELAARKCHVEVTTLVIPGENDSIDEMCAQAQWLAGIRPDIPLHISRFFPRYHMTDRDATPVQTMEALALEARRHLDYVYLGNV